MSSHPIRNIHVKSEPILIFVLASIQFTHILDFVIMMPLGSYFQESFYINPREFSFLISAYTYSAFCAGIVGALLIDRFNRKSAVVFFCILVLLLEPLFVQSLILIICFWLLESFQVRSGEF